MGKNSLGWHPISTSKPHICGGAEGAGCFGSCGGSCNPPPSSLARFTNSGGLEHMKRGSFVLGIVIVASSLSMTGCPPRMRIAEINRDPGRYYNREVTVVGRVTRSYGALGQGVYEIDDGTGRMWVLTEKYGVPGKDAYVGVRGRVYPGLTYEGRTYGMGMRETERRKHPVQ